MKKLNSKGIAHYILPVMAVLLVAVTGTYMIHKSSAASANPYTCAKPYPMLQLGTTNTNCVRHMQWDLMNLWPNNGGQYVRNSGGVTGSYNTGTKQGVQYFHYSKKVNNSGASCSSSPSSCDGIAGNFTWAVLESPYPAIIGFTVTGLPAGTNVRFTSSTSIGNCGTAVNVPSSKTVSCLSYSSIYSSGTFPEKLTVSGKTYTAYVGGGDGLISGVGGKGGCCSLGTGKFSVSDPAGDNDWHGFQVEYR